MPSPSKRGRQLFEPIEQDTIPFYGHELVAVVLEDGRIAAVLRWLCEGLHLDPQGQLQRIQRKTALTDGLVEVRVDTEGGSQEMPAITLDVLPGYLFTIDENRVKSEARDDVVLFQRECVKVLSEYFAKKGVGQLALPAPSTIVPADAQVATQVMQIVEQIDTMTGALNLMREHLATLLALPGQVAGLSDQMSQAVTMLEQLAERQDVTETQLAAVDERTQRLTPAHTRTVQELVERLVRETKYLPQPLTYAIIYGRLKHRFRVGSYKEVTDSRFDELVSYLHEELQRASSGATPEQGSLF